MFNPLRHSAEILYANHGREAAIVYIRGSWKLKGESGQNTLENLVDWINYIADMSEGFGY
jgi:hypothetical protein